MKYNKLPFSPVRLAEVNRMTHTKVYGRGQQTSSKWPDSKFGGSFAGHMGSVLITQLCRLGMK